MPQTVLAVIAGADYEGEDFSTLRLFDCRSTAQAYADHLRDQIAVDYVLVEERVIDFTSALAVNTANLNTADGITTPW